MEKNVTTKIFQKVKNSYLSLALLLLNSLLFILLINGAISSCFWVRDTFFPSRQYLPELTSKFSEDGTPALNGKRNWTHEIFFDRRAFGEEYTDQQVGEILDEFSDLNVMPPSYAGMGITEPPLFAGKHIRVQKDFSGMHYRWTPSADRAAQKKDFTVYTIGASSTFGNSVDDRGTWPAKLDELLSAKFPEKNIQVVNYGRAGFDVTLETDLLLLLIQKGHKPDLVVFFDGSNEFRGVQADHFGADDFKKIIEASYHPKEPSFFDVPLIKQMGLAKMALHIKNRLTKPAQNFTIPRTEAEFGTESKLLEIVERTTENYVLNKATTKSIAEANRIKTLFFTNPDVLYNYNLELLKKQVPGFYTEERRHFKELFYSALKTKTDNIRLLDLFEKWGNRKAIVDDCHFSPAFAKFIAENMLPYVSSAIESKSLLENKIASNHTAPTRTPASKK